jgi:hypothetical protein
MARTEYGDAILPACTPERAVDIMRHRLNQAKLANDEIADWIKERTKIEDNYAQELDKLGRRPPISNEAGLGTFTATWNDIIKSARENAKTSMDFARKVRSDIETPIRNFTSRSPQWADVRTIHDGLSGVAKNLEESEDHYAKVRHNKKKAGAKTEAAQVSLAETRSQWENQAPYAFGQFEAVDEARLVFLKDTLTRLQTLEADKAQAAIGASERTLNSILSFEPIEEIRSFAAQIVAGGGPSQSLHAAPSSHSDDFHPGGRTGDDSSSINSGNTPLGSGAAKLRSKVGSIFRSKNKPPKHQNPASSRVPANAPRTTASATVSRASTLPSELGGTGSTPPPARSSTTVKPPPPPSRRANGQAASDGQSTPVQQTMQPSPMQPLQPTPISQPGLQKQPAQPVQPNVLARPTAPENAPSDEDSLYDQQPFRVNIRQDVITEEKEDAEEALSNVASTLRARPTVSGRSSRGRRDIQSRLFTGIDASDLETVDSFQPIDTTATGASPQKLYSQLQDLQSPSDEQSGGSVISPVSPVSRASQEGQPGAAFAPAAGPFVPPAAPFRSSASDVHSIHSQGSVWSPTVGSMSIGHPEVPNAVGMVATVVEVLNVTLSDGMVSQSNVAGEIAFGYNANKRPGSLYVRSAASEQLQPNPALMRTSADNVFKVDTNSGIVGARQGLLGLKYNLQDSSDHAPLVFTPIWRVEENLSRLMLTYKLADSYPEDMLELYELTVVVPVEGAQALSAQSKPVALFNQERQRIAWRFTEPVTVKKGVEERLLCQFASEGLTREGAAGVDIRFKLTAGPRIPLEYSVKEQQDPFGDNPANSTTSLSGEWIPVVTVRTVVTGKYTAHGESNVVGK